MLPRLRRLARSSDTGAELVEYALLAPILLSVLFATADFGLLFQAYEVVSNAAREGARMGVMACNASDTSPECYHAADIQARVEAFVNAGLPVVHATPTTVASCVTISPGAQVAERVTVSYTYTFRFLSPVSRLIGGQFTTVPLQAVSTMRRENQTACQ